MSTTPPAAAATYRVSITRGSTTLTADLDETSAGFTVHRAVMTNLTVRCRRLRDDEPRLTGITTSTGEEQIP